MITANLAGMATMALHPLPRELADPYTRVLNVAVHALAMISAPLALIGGIALARRTGSLSAAVFQGFALVAALLATAMSGLVATALLQQSAPHELLLMTGALNQAFSRTFAVGTSVALVLWSIAGWRGHSLPRSRDANASASRFPASPAHPHIPGKTESNMRRVSLTVAVLVSEDVSDRLRGRRNEERGSGGDFPVAG